MKWLLSALGSSAIVAALSHPSGVSREPLTGIELRLDRTLSSLGSAPLGTLEIEGLQGAVSARRALSPEAAPLVALPPGLYGLRFVPDSGSPVPAVLAAVPPVVLVTARVVTRVDVRLHAVAQRGTALREPTWAEPERLRTFFHTLRSHTSTRSSARAITSDSDANKAAASAKKTTAGPGMKARTTPTAKASTANTGLTHRARADRDLSASRWR